MGSPDDAALLAGLAAKRAHLRACRAEVRALRREAFRSHSPWRWAHLVLQDQLHGVEAGSHLWARHPHVRTGSQLTFGERAADVMRNAFGSWAFVGGFLGFMALWMLVNTVLLGTRGWDHYPYILLNLALSMMAGLQGALILIAAKRSDRVAAEQSLSHYTETGKLDHLITENNAMTERIETAVALLDEIHRHVSGRPGRVPPPDDDCTLSTGPSPPDAGG